MAPRIVSKEHAFYVFMQKYLNEDIPVKKAIENFENNISEDIALLAINQYI